VKPDAPPSSSASRCSTPAELARGAIFAKGIPLSHPEAVALLADEVMLAAPQEYGPTTRVIDNAGGGFPHGRPVASRVCPTWLRNRDNWTLPFPGRHQARHADRPRSSPGENDIRPQGRSSSAIEPIELFGGGRATVN